MYASITNVIPANGFTLVVTFSNGQTRILDMSPFLDFGVFRQIKKSEDFKKVHIAFDTIEWDCGVDLDPEFVMNKSIPMQQ